MNLTALIALFLVKFPDSRRILDWLMSRPGMDKVEKNSVTPSFGIKTLDFKPISRHYTA